MPNKFSLHSVGKVDFSEWDHFTNSSRTIGLVNSSNLCSETLLSPINPPTNNFIRKLRRRTFIKFKLLFYYLKSPSIEKLLPRKVKTEKIDYSKSLKRANDPIQRVFSKVNLETLDL